MNRLLARVAPMLSGGDAVSLRSCIAGAFAEQSAHDLLKIADKLSLGHTKSENALQNVLADFSGQLI